MFEFSIREILPHVYHLHFASGYDLAMHFLRFQEYYESPKYYRRIFSLTEYMEWYAKEHEGAFTYPKDWSGFNVPSWVLTQVRNEEFRNGIPDVNRYDRLMFQLIDWVESREHPHNYYFIGTSTAGYKGDESEASVLDHEIAHALYHVEPEYRENVDCLVHEWLTSPKHKGEEFNSARNGLKAMGYHPSTTTDEIHAYCATGLCDELEGVISKKEVKPFQKLFKEFKRKCTNAESK